MHNIIFDFALPLILGDLGADSGGKGKCSWLSTEKSGTNDYAKFEEGGGGGGGGKQLIMAMLKWYFFFKMLAYRFCIDERKRTS